MNANYMWTGLQVESGPTTPLPDKKLLVFILDRLQKCVFWHPSFYLFLLMVSTRRLINLYFNSLAERIPMRCSPSPWIQKRCISSNADLAYLL